MLTKKVDGEEPADGINQLPSEGRFTVPNRTGGYCHVCVMRMGTGQGHLFVPHLFPSISLSKKSLCNKYANQSYDEVLRLELNVQQNKVETRWCL